MMRALFAGVSGLRNHQTKMDVIGNNIANVNTVGYKSSRVTLQEAFNQLLQGATRPIGGSGGLNPIQIGSGVNLGSTDQLFTQGSLETTGQPLDLGIQGDSLFVLSNGGQREYTRAGNFQLDANGNLISGTTGAKVQGILADVQGNFTSTSTLTDISLKLGEKAPANATSLMYLSGNLDAAAAIGTVHTMGTTAYDSAGAAHDLQVTYTNTGPGSWTWTATCADAPVTPATTGTVTFNPDGTLKTFTYPGGGTDLTLTPANGGAFKVQLNPGTIGSIDGLSGYANQSNVVVTRQDGYAAGDLNSISVDAHGIVTGYYNNGIQRSMAQIGLARFTNPSGLTRIGGNAYAESPNSGLPAIGFASGNNSSRITSGALESSNVDISQEFTDLIVAQRGFQANAKVITTADEMLNDLVNLKR